MMKILLLFVVSLLNAKIAFGGFNWGTGCDGGSGNFAVNLTTKNEIVTLGTIVKGKCDNGVPK